MPVDGLHSPGHVAPHTSFPILLSLLTELLSSTGQAYGSCQPCSAVGQYESNSICDSSHTLSHVSAHQDQPWNELEDSLAKANALADF